MSIAAAMNRPRSMNGGAREGLATTAGRTVGYARVSTDGQSLDGQLATLKAAGATKLFAEKQSGTRSDRVQLRKAINTLGKGDTLIGSRLDRLARSMRDLLNMLHEVGEHGASFKSLHDPWADTTTPHGKLLLTVLGGLAEFERELIRERTGEGRKRAMAAGVRFGRPKVLSPFQAAEAARRRQAGEPLSLIAQAYRVSVSTIARLQP
jgi:DNA invertase Pin-like site-specific DNA recombinase